MVIGFVPNKTDNFGYDVGPTRKQYATAYWNDDVIILGEIFSERFAIEIAEDNVGIGYGIW